MGKLKRRSFFERKKKNILRYPTGVPFLVKGVEKKGFVKLDVSPLPESVKILGVRGILGLGEPLLLEVAIPL